MSSLLSEYYTDHTVSKLCPHYDPYFIQRPHCAYQHISSHTSSSCWSPNNFTASIKHHNGTREYNHVVELTPSPTQYTLAPTYLANSSWIRERYHIQIRSAMTVSTIICQPLNSNPPNILQHPQETLGSDHRPTRYDCVVHILQNLGRRRQAQRWLWSAIVIGGGQ